MLMLVLVSLGSINNTQSKESTEFSELVNELCTSAACRGAKVIFTVRFWFILYCCPA